MSVEDYRLPAPLAGMLLAANFTRKPVVQTDLQPTKLAVTITWYLVTSAPKKSKNRPLSKTAKPEPANRRQPATSSTSTVQQLPPARQPEQPPARQSVQPLCQTPPPPSTTIPAPSTATLIFSRPTKTVTPAPKPTATVQQPAPKPDPAEKRPASSPDTHDTRPTQQQRRVSPTVTAINDQPLTSTAATTNDENLKNPPTTSSTLDRGKWESHTDCTTNTSSGRPSG